MKIAVIPARGGSKRIPRKNIKTFRGVPMIAWAIRAATASGLFDEVVVSTDDEEIRECANQYGALTPFIRPDSLSDDHTPTAPVVEHAVKECQSMGWRIEHVCCIYPSVPLLASSDLIRAYDLLVAEKSNFVYPVTEFAHPIQRAMSQTSTGHMRFIDPGAELTRTQDLETTYHDAGQFYWGTLAAWLGKLKMHSEGIGIHIPNWRVVDIDNHDDWKRAELLSYVLQNDLSEAFE